MKATKHNYNILLRLARGARILAAASHLLRMDHEQESAKKKH